MGWISNRRTTRQSGFSLIEVLVSAVFLSVALLGYAASAVKHQIASVQQSERGIALLTAERFIERMRSDTDWTGLYGRLRPFTVETTGDAALANLGVDTSLAAQAPTAYYGDFTVPTRLGTVTILVQTPSITDAGVAALRENVNAPKYGLPGDLNADGVIDGNSRNGDYRALPVVVHLRWRHGGNDPQEVVVATWLRYAQ
jgi:prepilin-type N-terminal cleavage/methylation domain-containing protein